MGILYVLHTKLSDSTFQEHQLVTGMLRSVHLKSDFFTHAVYDCSPIINFWRKEIAEILIMIAEDILKQGLLCSKFHELSEPGL